MDRQEMQKAFDELCKRDSFTVLDVDAITKPKDIEQLTWGQLEAAYAVALSMERRALKDGKIRWNHEKMRFEKRLQLVNG